MRRVTTQTSSDLFPPPHGLYRLGRGKNYFETQHAQTQLWRKVLSNAAPKERVRLSTRWCTFQVKHQSPTTGERSPHIYVASTQALAYVNLFLFWTSCLQITPSCCTEQYHCMSASEQPLMVGKEDLSGCLIISRGICMYSY